jgi:hypothetical protein
MRRFARRLGKAEQVVQPRPIFLHVGPNQTEAKARAAHERKHGPIPKDAQVIVICHTFVSRL